MSNITPAVIAATSKMAMKIIRVPIPICPRSRSVLDTGERFVAELYQAWASTIRIDTWRAEAGGQQKSPVIW